MLTTCNCKNCAKSIGILQYPDYYYCKNHYGKYVCIECYEILNKKCEKCNTNLSFHNSDETKEFQRDNNILY